ncbi:ABC transporter substrate-binding protein [Arthrobacter sp. NPDC080031]|uniref:ABC transporter substrate-binding protein n=1 Tax=Arthrobacter sp. NPDC080031 TaxID=3155918 RepID=UPI00344B7B26
MVAAPNMLDPLDVLLRGPDSRALRLGLVAPLSGGMGMIGPTVIEASRLAASEINSRSSERPVELVLVDSGGQPESVASMLGDLIAENAVSAFVGLHTSYTLEAIERSLGSKVPYIVTAGHEAVNRLPGFYCAGETPLQSTAGIAWLMRERNIDTWAVINTDYVYPRVARTVQCAAIQASGGSVVFDITVPQGTVPAHVATLVQGVCTSGARGVLLNMEPRDVVTVLRALRSRRLDNKIVRFAPGTIEENALYAIGGDSSGNLFASMHHFDAHREGAREELAERYRKAFTADAPTLTSWGERSYHAVHILSRLDAEGLLVPASLGTPNGQPYMHESIAGLPAGAGQLAVANGLKFEIVMP